MGDGRTVYHNFKISMDRCYRIPVVFSHDTLSEGNPPLPNDKPDKTSEVERSKTLRSWHHDVGPPAKKDIVPTTLRVKFANGLWMETGNISNLSVSCATMNGMNRKQRLAMKQPRKHFRNNAV